MLQTIDTITTIFDPIESEVWKNQSSTTSGCEDI